MLETYTSAAPKPPAPRHPIRTLDKGVNDMTNPRMALLNMLVVQEETMLGGGSTVGLGWQR